MKPISRRVHGIADYLMVVVLLSMPTALGFTGVPRALSYALAFAHIVLTALSSFPPGAVALIPFRVHAFTEMVIGAFLVVSAWLLGFAGVAAARDSFLLIGVILIALPLLTNFDRRGRALAPPPGERRRWNARKG